MSDIAPIGRPNAAALSTTTRQHHSEAPTAAVKRGSDSVELSNHAQLLSKLADLPDVRQDKIDRARAAIDDGVYETPAKIDAILDDVLADIS